MRYNITKLILLLLLLLLLIIFTVTIHLTNIYFLTDVTLENKVSIIYNCGCTHGAALNINIYSMPKIHTYLLML